MGIDTPVPLTVKNLRNSVAINAARGSGHLVPDTVVLSAAGIECMFELGWVRCNAEGLFVFDPPLDWLELLHDRQGIVPTTPTPKKGK